jgi:hypothetical protein
MLHVFAGYFSARYHAFQNRRLGCPAQLAEGGGRRKRLLVARQGLVKAATGWGVVWEGSKRKRFLGEFVASFCPWSDFPLSRESLW